MGRTTRIAPLLVAAATALAACSTTDGEQAASTTVPGVVGTTATTPVAGSTTVGGGDATRSSTAPSTRVTTTPSTEPSLPNPVATVAGPIDGTPANAMPASLADTYDYVESEYFLSGTAASYSPVGEIGDDGGWTVEPAATAPYATRVIVRRPNADFGGTVYVEWFNVTSGVDADSDFGYVHPVIFDERAAYVGVSAQSVAVEGGPGMTIDIDGAPTFEPLKDRNPARYGDLAHPGDEYSYDIFAQVAQVLRSGALLDGAVPQHVIAIGQSQSAGRLVTFANAIQPVTAAYDGFLVHSRGGGAAPLGPDDDPTAAFVGGSTHIRSDAGVPVLQFVTETDLTLLNFVSARQPDHEYLVTWEVAGTAHADRPVLDYGRQAYDDAVGAELDLAAICPDINDGPQGPVLRAAISALGGWVRTGTRPASGDPIMILDGAIVRDADGIAVDGIRTPDVDAPIAAHTGASTSPDIICILFGSTRPFTPQRLAELYPDHDAYVAAVTASADAALEAGHLLESDRDALLRAANDTPVP